MNIGFKKDILVGWVEVVKKNGFLFGISFYVDYVWSWYELV